MKNRIKELARKAAEELNSDGVWLGKSLQFNHGAILVDTKALQKAETLLDEFMQNSQRHRNRDQKLLDINIVCANLLCSQGDKPIAISLNRNDYISTSRYTKARYYTTKIVSHLEQAGWINLKKGYNGKDKSRLTRIWPTHKFLNFFDPLSPPDFSPVELVNLRNKDHKPIAYQDSRETKRIRSILHHANTTNRKVKVHLKNRKQALEHLNTDLYAVFNNSSFKQGGRLYNVYGGYQYLSSKNRKNILIDYQPTVELDFSGMQPRLLYAKENIQYDDDPYVTICQDNPELRPFVKVLLLPLLNSASVVKAVASGNYELQGDYELYRTLKELGISTKKLIASFIKTHSTIAKYFGTQVGFELMNLDGKIALEIVEHFTSRNIPILAIHDSFVVTEDKQEQLKKVMEEAYKKHTGFSCPIKVIDKSID